MTVLFGQAVRGGAASRKHAREGDPVYGVRLLAKESVKFEDQGVAAQVEVPLQWLAAPVELRAILSQLPGGTRHRDAAKSSPTRGVIRRPWHG